MSCPYPFSAIVGQEGLKLALLLNAASPEVGGVLVRGEKGTAKSTAVRSLASLLPNIEVVAGCPYACDPDSPNPDCPAGPHSEGTPARERPVRLVDLPVGASTDRLTGTLDIGKALSEGVKSFEPGLFAAAHRGILYVDEVNLLPDHLVDLLLDVAAMGVNHVEREGVGIAHPSRFLLVGTMNPEEGELRPQLLDRFGLSVEAAGGMEVEERTEVVRRRLRYESDPESFAADWREADAEVAARVMKARDALPLAQLPDGRLRDISALCANLGVDGLRGDIVTAKAALALASWEGRGEVGRGDVERAALLALAHRKRRSPFDEPGVTPEEIEGSLPEDPENPPDPPDGGGEPPEDGGEPSDGNKPGGEPDGSSDGSGERSFTPSSGGFDAGRMEVRERGAGGPAGRRSRSVGERGHPVGDRPAEAGETDIALAATIRTAAGRGGPADGRILVDGTDLRANVREGREGNLVVFCVDASGSMAARQRMSAVKGAVMELLSDSYRKRDRISLVSFRGDAATTLLPPTSSVDQVAARLAELPTGGRTPLSAGLEEAARTILHEQKRDPNRRPLLVILTDGRATSGPNPKASAKRLRRLGASSVVVDTEAGYARLGLAEELAAALGGRCLTLDDMSSRSLAGVVAAAKSDGRSVA
ncbi:MAG: magnesium chelatase subunit D family protein [Actinomycetota bacterium]|nr:magnesium chelatase subunit D family protein [Rubrobacter sp.]MDQ3506792.1 magnesium chelatase subunit D family protein [Actinomycetota bacterium]